MRHAANGRRVLILTATSGDTGSAAMQGFAGVDGTEIVVFYPASGTSRIQRLQMTTPSDANVHAVGIRGNFDDAQAAVKRIFADPAIAEEAAAHGVTLSSANSINTGRLVPQVAYYVLAGAKLRAAAGAPPEGVPFDVVVPSGNFGNILAAHYAKLLGAPIRRLVVASNVNDVLARFVKTGVYDPGPKFTVTNSPSMDIRRSSNVERLLWLLNFDGDVASACAETARLMRDLDSKGRYELNDGSVRVQEVAGGVPCVVTATATPYKFPETCMRAFGADVLSDPPPAFAGLERLPVAQTKVVDVAEIDAAVRELF